MLLYKQTAAPATLWPEPMEATWQMLPGGWEQVGLWKRPDITLCDRLFISAVVNIPRPQRPWGAITWLAGVYRISRETVYTIGERGREAFLLRTGSPRRELAPWNKTSSTGLALPAPTTPSGPSGAPTLTVTDNRLKRTILTLLLPGGVTTRPMQDCLEAAFDHSPSVGFLSELINEAGRRAGEILDKIDFSPLGDVILARDETFFDDFAFLLSVEPRCQVIVSGYVEEGCDAEHWGVALQIDHRTRGLRIVGLAEDAARYYPASLEEAELSVPIQKDVWHPMAKAFQTVVDLERVALKALERAEKLEKPLHEQPWDDGRFEAWVEASDTAEALVEMSAELRFWRSCLCDALEIVDWRSGEIRDREINQWLLDETIQGLRQLDHLRIRALLTYLEAQREELLTFLDWLEVRLFPWQRRLVRTLPDARERRFFQRVVARAWRLSRAVVNGHTNFRQAAEEAQALLVDLIADDEALHRLAEELSTILEGVIRTGCAAETAGSILKPYLWVKRSFQSRETAQNFLNLFMLWFNMHPFKRGKRAGKSPFQWAGIKVYTPEGREIDDWLEALGYPAKA